MYSRGVTVLDSPYRATTGSVSRRDYAPSSGGYGPREDRRDELYSGRGMNSPPRFSSDASVATSMLNGMIDGAIGSFPSPSSSAYRSASVPRQSLSSDYSDLYARRNLGSGFHNYRRDISEPRGRKFYEPVREIPRDYTQATYRTRDSSPSHRDMFDNGTIHTRNNFEADEIRRNMSVARDSRHRSGDVYSNAVSEYGSRIPYLPSDQRFCRSNEANVFRDHMGPPSHSRDYIRSNFEDGRSPAAPRETNHPRRIYEDDRSFAASRGGEFNRLGDERSYAPTESRDIHHNVSIPAVHENFANEIFDERTLEGPGRDYSREGMPPAVPMNSRVPHLVQGGTPKVPSSVQSGLTSFTGADNRVIKQNLMIQSVKHSLSTINAVTNEKQGSIADTKFDKQTIRSNHSLASAVTMGSTWHNTDILLLPKGQKVLGAALAATATASMIVDDHKSVCDFETALKALSDMVEPTVKNDNMPSVIESSILGQPQEEHSHIPVSYSSVRDSVKRGLMVTSALEAQDPTDTVAKESHQLWARCALLVSAAILKADPNRIRLAQTAAEAVMTNGIATINDNWLDTADEDLRNVANAACSAIQASPDGDEVMADLSVVAILGDGGKFVSMERIRRSLPSNIPASDGLAHGASKGCENSRITTETDISSFEMNSREIDDMSSNRQNGTTSMAESQMKSRSNDYPPTSSRRQLRGSSTIDLHSNLHSLSGQSSGLHISPVVKSSASQDGPADVSGNEALTGVRRSRSLLDTASSSNDEETENVPSLGVDLSSKPRGADVEDYTTGLNPSRSGAKREELTKALNKILGQSDEEPKPKTFLPVQSQPHCPNPALAGKRDEIAQRVQRIQMRAAARRDVKRASEQVNKISSVSGHEGPPRGANDLETNRKQPRSHRPRGRPIPGVSDTSLDGSIFSPVVNFLSSMNCNLESSFLPDDEEDMIVNMDESRVTNKPIDNNEWASFKHAETMNVQKSNGYGDALRSSKESIADHRSEKLVQNAIVSTQRNVTDTTPSHVQVDAVPNVSRQMNIAHDESDNGTQAWEMLEDDSIAGKSVRRSPSIQPLAAPGGLKRTSSSDTSGAFSDAFEGKVSNISIAKLSLTPPSHNLETSQGLFLQHSSGLPYQSVQVDDTDNVSVTSNVSAWRAKQKAESDANVKKKKGIKGRLPLLRKPPSK